MEQVVVFQTITGETGVGRLNEEKKVIEKIVKPVQVAQEIEGQQVVGITLVPYMVPFSHKYPSISLDKVVVYAPAIPELEKQYIEATSGIKIARPEDLKKIRAN